MSLGHIEHVLVQTERGPADVIDIGGMAVAGLEVRASLRNEKLLPVDEDERILSPTKYKSVEDFNRGVAFDDETFALGSFKALFI